VVLGRFTNLEEIVFRKDKTRNPHITCGYHVRHTFHGSMLFTYTRIVFQQTLSKELMEELTDNAKRCCNIAHFISPATYRLGHEMNEVEMKKYLVGI